LRTRRSVDHAASQANPGKTVQAGEREDDKETMPHRLSKLVYVSDAVEPMTRESLHALTERICERNHRKGVTGVLLYGNGHFMQVLEGDLTTLSQTFGRIQRDKRHRHVRLLYFQPIAKRSFGEWAMKVINLDDQRMLDRRPFRTLLEEAGTYRADPETPGADLAMQLMEEFGRQLEMATNKGWDGGDGVAEASGVEESGDGSSRRVA